MVFLNTIRHRPTFCSPAVASQRVVKHVYTTHPCSRFLGTQRDMAWNSYPHPLSSCAVAHAASDVPPPPLSVLARNEITYLTYNTQVHRYSMQPRRYVTRKLNNSDKFADQLMENPLMATARDIYYEQRISIASHTYARI